MKILGIDYGRSKIGLAIAEGPLAQPYKVLRFDNPEARDKQLEAIIRGLKIEKIVVGVSEGKMGEESKEFARALGAETFDETLSTQEAQELAIEAGVPRKKRRNMEDAFAAAVMLQSYLDYV